MDLRTVWSMLPRSVRRFPPDLAMILGVVALTVLLRAVPVVPETPLRVVLGTLFVLFAPGYTFVAALFPENAATSEGVIEEQSESGTGNFDGRSIDGVERVALSVALSVVLVALVGLFLNFTFGVRFATVVTVTSVLTVTLAVFAAVRRQRLPPSERFRVPYERWFVSARSGLSNPGSRKKKLLNVLLIVSVLAATASVVYALSVPKQDPAFTEFYLLSRGDSGELLADDYPTEYVSGEGKNLTVGIGNYEQRRTAYTVVVRLRQVETANGSTRVLDQRTLHRFRPVLEHGETWHRSHRIVPTTTGENLQLQYLLFRGDPPQNISAESAYRETHLWVNVSAPNR
ncbi:DUF1616 domain-containing protein [Haladaptatus sp. NG-SE-30]